MEAVLAAKKEGKIRYIGFTGHNSPDIHLKMLETAFAPIHVPCRADASERHGCAL
jgi:predicted aldo/keto reductase-like oxidoreductase